MINEINSKIGVSFYLKKMSHDNSVTKRAVYATIAYAGTSAKMKTGFVCADPKNDWRRGMFEGRRFSDCNLQLLVIKNKIESFDTRFCKSATHIKDLYNGVKIEDIPMTILEVFKESLERKTNGKKDRVKEGSLTNLKSAIKIFKLWMRDTQRPDFGVVQSHPHKIKKRLIEKFYEWDLERVQEVTANNHILLLHTLYELFHKSNHGDLEGLVPNPFKGIIGREEEQERVKKALDRCVDWKWIEKIENLKYKLPKGIAINKVELWDKYWIHERKHDVNLRAVKNEKFRLLTLILAYTGLSFVDLGKTDVLSINRTMDGGKVLSGRRVKTKQVYTIPVTPKLEALIKEMGSLPWQSFVDDNLVVNYRTKAAKYLPFNKYMDRVLTKHIGWDEDYSLTPHRLRHTFAMRQLNHFGFSLMVVSRMLGDNEDTVRKNYADHDDDAISKAFNEEMARFNKRQQEEDDDLESEVAV